MELGRAALPPDKAGGRTLSKGRRVETCPIDVGPEPLVRWFIADHQCVVPKFDVVAGCVEETRDLPLRKELRIGDEVGALTMHEE